MKWASVGVNDLAPTAATPEKEPATMNNPIPTQAALKELLHYDPATGIFRWLVDISRRMRAGSIAGTVAGKYRAIRVLGDRYQEHNLAWLYMKGEWPPALGLEIDHEDLDGLNNRWVNLRIATPSQNRWNSRRRKDNTSGVKGVSWHALARKWRARISFRGQEIHLGLFADLGDAEAAVREAREWHHGQFARNN